MTWQDIAQYCDCACALGLIARLLSLKLQRVYFAFCFFLFADLLGSLSWIGAQHLAVLQRVDYRFVWLADRFVVWGFTVWAVSELLNAILSNYRGIYRLANQVLRYCWIAALSVTAVSAIWEYRETTTNAKDVLLCAISIGLVAERAVATVSLLALLLTLAFLLWFPIELPKNLATFSVGFIVYFFLKSILLFARGTMSQGTADIVSLAIAFLSAACLLYWTFALDAGGERIKSQVRPKWDLREQHELLQQLEGLNQSILGAIRR